MTTSGTPVTLTALVAQAADTLEGAGFRTVDPSATGDWRATATRVYEDPYSIVCIAVYETWADLSSLWLEDQATAVGLISENFVRTEPKAWDGYLVLLTPSTVPEAERSTAISIQRDTLYLRKLIADGDELQALGAVRRTLLPLLPIEEYEALKPRSVLDALLPLLARHGVDEESATVAIEAFRSQRSIMEDLHALTERRRGRNP